MEFNRKNMQRLVCLITFSLLLYNVLQNPQRIIGALSYVFGLMMPFIVGACLAFVLNVPMSSIERMLLRLRFFKDDPEEKRMSLRRILSIILALLIVVGVIVIVLFMVVPELYNSITAIGSELAQARFRIPGWLDTLAERFPAIEQEILAFKQNFEQVNWKEVGIVVVEFFVSENFLSNTVGLASSVFSGVANTFIGLVFAIYVLMQKERLGKQMQRLFYAFFPSKLVERWIEICRLTADTFHSFLSGQCLEALILGTMFFISMSILKMPYALVVGVLIAVTALIPIFGAFIGCVIGALLILIVNPMQAVWFLVLFLVLQQIEGNLIYPYVVGGSVGLPSLWVLVAVTLGANFGGVLGMLFAIPIFSVLYSLLRQEVHSRLSIKQQKVEQSDG